jgi:hypothetical protein
MKKEFKIDKTRLKNWPLCRSARRRAAVLWLLTWRHAEAHAAVLLCPRAANARALQKQTPPCCFALAGVAPDRSARRRAAAPCQAWRGAGRLAKAVFLIRRKGGGGGAWAALAVALGRPKGSNFRDRLRRYREARSPRAS